MIPPSYVVNPLFDVVVHAEEGADKYIDVAAYSRLRGFLQGRLTKGETPGFDAALRFLDGGAVSGSPQLSPVEAMVLWQLGLIVLPGECAAPFTSPTPLADRDDYLQHGFILLPELITPEATRLLQEHYRACVAAGKLPRGDRQADRFYVHNDPAGRVAQRALHKTIERVVGTPVKGSYTYASLYRGGSDLPLHSDRPQCRYTLSLQIDHNPLAPDGRSPWPVQLYLHPDAPPLDCFQTVGGGILFRGCEIPHGRPILPPDQESWLLLLHYVDANFEGPLD